MNKIIIIFCFYFSLTMSALAKALDVNKTDIQTVELVGTIIGKHTLAVLRIKNQSEGIYQQNQKILGYTIKSITKQSVLLTQQYKSIRLTLVPVKNRKHPGTKHSATQANRPSYEYRINRNTFNSLQTDTQSWLDNIRMLMHIENGYFTGYKISYIRDNSPAELLGLIKDDIIIGIDNILVKHNAEDFIKKLGKLENTNMFVLNMKRKQQEFNLVFHIDDKK